MILTQADGTKREISSDELRDMIRKAPRNEPVRPFACPELYEDQEIAQFNFVVDTDGRMTALPVWERKRRQSKLLRNILLSVSLAALAGFIMAGL